MDKVKTLTDYQVRILEKILQDSIKTVTYRNPQKELGDLAEDPTKVSDAFHYLENKGVLALKPVKKLGIWDRSVYEIDLAKSRTLFDSY